MQMIEWIENAGDCGEITQVTWRRRLVELTRGGNNLVFNAFLYLQPMQRFENMVRIEKQQHEQEHSGCVEGDLTEFEKDNSTSNCSSQVWSEQKMCR